jgi:ABC-2 type transport system ATP-binding protein
MQESVLRIQNLSKRFQDVVAVEEVSLTVEEGEIFGFLGPNGAGKTTTISMVLGLLHPTGGRVELFGEPVDPAHVRPLRRVGSLVGAPALIPSLSARRNLRLLGRLYEGITDERVEEVLNIVGLREAADRKVGGFSLGMKQRLGLGAALLHQPDILILDEPTNGLDPAGMREIRELLSTLAAGGVTVFLSSHLLHEVEQVCDRVAVLNRGRVVAEGRVSELLSSQAVVRVRVPDPTAAAAVLQTLAGATAVTPNGHYVHAEGVTAEAVNRHLMEHGIVAGELTSGRADLESVFLQLTQ